MDIAVDKLPVPFQRPSSRSRTGFHLIFSISGDFSSNSPFALLQHHFLLLYWITAISNINVPSFHISLKVFFNLKMPSYLLPHFLIEILLLCIYMFIYVAVLVLVAVHGLLSSCEAWVQ